MDNPGFYSRNKRWILPILVILVSALVVMLLASLRGEPPREPEENTAALVEVVPVQMQPLRLIVNSQGTVNAKYSTSLVAQVSGEILRVSPAFVRGGVVKKGELLAEIDPTNYQVRLEEARAGVASAVATLELEEAQGKVAEAEWRNIDDRLPPALGLRQPQIEQARAQVTAARAALKQAEKDLARTRILAPYDALVAGREVSPGTFVNVGGAIGQVLDLSTAEVRLPIANSELLYLQDQGVGATAVLKGRVDGREKTWRARIVRNEGVIDQDSRMSYLVAEIGDPYNLQPSETDGAQEVLPFGAYVVADIQGRELAEATRIPRYLIRDGRVAVAAGNQLVFKDVEVLRNVGGSSVVTGGLETGDMLITTALDFPVEGMDIEVVRDETSGRSPEAKAATGAE